MVHIIISFLFYNLLLIIFYRHYKKGDYYINKSDLFFYTILLIAFGTYGGGEGDYLHYKKAVENIHSLADVFYYTGMEVQYYYLAYLSEGSYTLWRFFIFSIQFFGLGWFLYKAKLNTYPILLTFTSLFLVTSVYGRVYWGVIYFFMGCYLLIEKKNPLYLFAIGLCYVSHTSNLILIVLLPFAFIDLKKWHLLLIILLFGSIVTLFNDYFKQFLNSGGIDGADYLYYKVNSYSNSTAYVRKYFGQSIGEMIIFLLRYVPILLFLCVLLINFSSSNKSKESRFIIKYKQIYKPIRGVLNVFCGLIIASFVFLFAEMNNGAYFYRVLAMALFPVSIILPYMAKIKIIKKQTFNIFIFLFLFATEANYMKDIYYAYVAGI